MITVAYSYMRFSTEQQTWGDSRRRQALMATLFAAKHKLELDDSLTFRDLGVSAFHGRYSRAGALGSFLYAVELGLVTPGSYLLVESFDRLSRDRILSAQALFLQIIQAGIILVTLIDGRVYSADSINANPYELLISLVAMMRANEESATKSLRLKAAWKAKRARAHIKPLTSRCPSWLRLDRSSGTFEICPVQAETVRRIFREALDGHGHEVITKLLNKEEVPLLSGRRIEDAHWQSGIVARILSSPSVVGSLVPHTVEYVSGKRIFKALPPIPDYYPAIIDNADFMQVQELHATRSIFKHPDAFSRHGSSNIFARLARCHRCGGSMRLIACTQPHWRYFVCSRAYLQAGCIRRGVRYPELEDAFVDEIETLIEHCPWTRAESRITDQRMRCITERLSALRLDRADFIRTTERVHDVKIRPLRRLKLLDAEREALVDELSSLRSSVRGLTHLSLERRLDELRNAALTFDVDRSRLNAALRALFTAIKIDYVANTLTLVWRHGGRHRLKFNPDIMAIKDGWHATSAVPALRVIRGRKPRRRTARESGGSPKVGAL